MTVKKLGGAARQFWITHAYRMLSSASAQSRDYFLGVGMGDVAAPAAPSIPKVQCASTFFPCDFALMITLHDFSCNFCVTCYETVPDFGSKLAGTTPRPLTRICTLPGSI